MERKISKMAPLLHDIMKRVSPYHQFIGYTDFPKNWLYNEDKTFGKVEKLEIEYDDNGIFKSVTGFNKQKESISFERAWDDVKHIAYGFYKKNGKTELEISERISRDTISVSSNYINDPRYNVEMEVTRKPKSTRVFIVTLMLNGKKINGEVDISDMKIPKIAMDIVEELNKLSSTVTVAGIEDKLYSVLVKEFWIENSYGSLDWQHVADNVGTSLSDLFGPFVTAGYGLVSTILANWSSENSRR
ncbi:MAG: hypothetical protein CSB55_03640 [Candidatus Cloacimonadota bacterium]|nr:MAG: hypothetical protein CSB55_03640 [Candidatus Cloacimonadota bacterium]